jgi:hypothetical protein
MRYEWSGHVSVIVSHLWQVQPLPFGLWFERMILLETSLIFRSNVAGIVLKGDFPIVRSRDYIHRGVA